jgi:hypothetical protein
MSENIKIENISNYTFLISDNVLILTPIAPCKILIEAYKVIKKGKYIIYDNCKHLIKDRYSCLKKGNPICVITENFENKTCDMFLVRRDKLLQVDEDDNIILDISCMDY